MEKKICKKCNISKNICEFNKDKYSKDGFRYRCKSCTSKEYKKYYYSNKEYEINRQIKYQINNPEKVKKRRREKHFENYNNDIIYKLKINLRNRMKLFLKSKNFNEIKNGTLKIIGCTPQELKEYIEKQFKDGMSWENYGFYGWHIDHIIPLSSAKEMEDVYRLSHYTNLQPLWCYDNYEKGNKII